MKIEREKKEQSQQQNRINNKNKLKKNHSKRHCKVTQPNLI